MEAITILPAPFLHILEEDSMHMALAHVVLADSAYAEFYKRMSKEGKFVIMDNGAYEKHKLTPDELAKAARKIEASEVILPDVLGSGAETIIDSWEALRYLREKLPECKFAVVVQGQNIAEWYTCAMPMLTWDINTLCVPKHIMSNVGDNARMLCLKSIKDRIPQGRHLHLLGCGKHVEEVALVGKEFGIRSVDSSVPWVYAKEELLLGQNNRPVNTVIDFSDETVDTNLLRCNIILWKELCNAM